MGNVTSLSPGQILPIEHYLEKTLPPAIWSKSKLKSHLGSTRFMKVGQIEHELEQSLVVKIFVIPDVAPNDKAALENDLELHVRKIREVTGKLSLKSNCLPWIEIERGEKAGFLIRQYVSRSLYDRFSTRPFLTLAEKKWISYQLIKALVTIHDADVVHGDLKCENILLTRDDWLLLADFAPFKPIQLPSDNPADFTYFFDTSRRRAAYLAPERFFNKVCYFYSITQLPELSFRVILQVSRLKVLIFQWIYFRLVASLPNFSMKDNQYSHTVIF